MEKYLKFATALLFASTLVLAAVSFNFNQENQELENEVQDLNSSLENLNSRIENVRDNQFSFGDSAITDTYIRFELEEFPALGNKSSKNTAIVFCSFNTESCQDFYNKKYDNISQQELSTGRYRFYAIQTASSGSKAAFEVSQCVKEKGSMEDYWDFFFNVYQNSDVLDLDNKEEMLEHAERVTSLEKSSLENCIDSNKFTQKGLGI